MYISKNRKLVKKKKSAAKDILKDNFIHEDSG